MARAPDDMLGELVARGITLSVYADDDPRRLSRLPVGPDPIAVHAYIDTGMSRMGIAYHRAMPFLREVAALRNCRLTGTFMTFTEDATFDREQLRRFQALAHDAASASLQLGKLHAASSHSIFHHRDVGFDFVRPGMSLYGGYPDRFDEERAMAELRPAFRLHSIIEVGDEERVRIGDIATCLGPDRPEIHPNEVARVTGSVYDLLMHLNPSLPRVVVSG